MKSFFLVRCKKAIEKNLAVLLNIMAKVSEIHMLILILVPLKKEYYECMNLGKVAGKVETFV